DVAVGLDGAFAHGGAEGDLGLRRRAGVAEDDRLRIGRTGDCRNEPCGQPHGQPPRTCHARLPGGTISGRLWCTARGDVTARRMLDSNFTPRTAVRTLCKFSRRTASGPEGSSAKSTLCCAAGPPGRG